MAARVHELQSIRILAWGRVFVAVILLALAGLVGRVLQLKLAPPPPLEAAMGTVLSNSRELTRRGCLLDRRGRLLASSVVAHRLFIDPGKVADPFTIAVDVAEALGVDPVPIDRRLAESRPECRYVPVVDRLERWQIDAVQRAALAGVGIEPYLERTYPHGEVGTGLVGLVGFEHTGLAGLERRFEPSLQGASGRLTYLRDVRRNALWVEPSQYEPSRPGQDVSLSIDLVIQEIAERHIAAAVKRQNAGGGRLVVLDCRSGEILAMADVLQSRRGWDEQTADPLRAREPALARNRCVSEPYEPGSTFKPFVWAVASELGRASMDEVLPTPAGCCHVTSRGRSIRDSTYYENATWHTVLVRSINSGMAIVAERLSHAEMQEALRRFGFGRRTRCGLPGESPGIVTAPRAWSHYTQTSVCMGHEVAVTTLQMVRAFSALTRDGTMPPLRVTMAAPGDDALKADQPAVSARMASIVRAALRDVVTSGTGQHARSPRWQLFGKSGTAQLPKKEGGGYHEDRYVASFIAGAPYASPRLVVLCVIDDPDRALGHFGGTIAGPVVRDVMEESLTYLGEPEDAPQDSPLELSSLAVDE